MDRLGGGCYRALCGCIHALNGNIRMTDTLFPNDEPQKKRRTRKQAKHDAVWDAVVVNFFPEGGAESQKGRVANLVLMVKDYFKHMGLHDIHRNAAVAIVGERKRLYLRDPYWSKQPRTPESILKHWNDVAVDPGVALRELCKEWLKGIHPSALVLSSSYDPLDRLAAYLLFQSKTGELAANRPDLAEAAAVYLDGRYISEAICAAVKELK